MDIIRQLTAQFGISEQQAGNTVRLIDEGNTIPFIARYRKEVHGGLDDQLLREISERLEYLRSLEKRKAEIVASIEAQEKMTPEIAQALENAKTLAEAEDIYLPYRPKKTTRASVAPGQKWCPNPKLRCLRASSSGRSRRNSSGCVHCDSSRLADA